MLNNPQKEEKEIKSKGNKLKTKQNKIMVDTSPNLLKTTLNVNGLNTPIKRQGLAE